MASLGVSPVEPAACETSDFSDASTTSYKAALKRNAERYAARNKPLLRFCKLTQEKDGNGTDSRSSTSCDGVYTFIIFLNQSKYFCTFTQDFFFQMNYQIWTVMLMNQLFLLLKNRNIGALDPLFRMMRMLLRFLMLISL